MTPPVVTPQFWFGRRVFVTGHTGFKGSWLSLWLRSMGAEVTGFALDPPSEPSLFDAAGVARDVADYRGNILNLARLRSAVVEAGPDVVFHLAAQPIVRISYAEPLDTLAVNIMGTAHLLEAVRACPSVRAVVLVTSDKCYENREWAWGYREHEAMGGFDPYSASKGCAELVIASYRRSFFGETSSARIASARAGNVIGGGDWACDRLVPDLMRAFMAGNPAVIRSPGAIRPWQHVLDVLSGYLMLAERLCTDGEGFDEGWNFGPTPESERPVSDLADRLVSSWGDGARWIQADGPQPHEAAVLKLDSAKARSRLGWRPRLNLNGALRLTAEWYRAFARGEDMRTLSLKQIANLSQDLRS